MDRLLTGLTDDQRHAVTTNAPILRIIAGAGSGKTRVLTHRIAHQAQARTLDPVHTLALTFTRKAAGELRQRLFRIGFHDQVAAGTFHARAWAQLTARWDDRGVQAPSLLQRRTSMLSRLAPGKLSRNDLFAVGQEIDWVRARRIPPSVYEQAASEARRTSPLAAGAMAQLLADYAQEKSRRRVVDFDDLLELCIRDMEDASHAAAVHWRFRHLFVDEFQDVNPLQFELLKAWLHPESSLCVVGDPRQAIYSWNGADPALLNNFETHFPGAETVRLSANFRSSPQILRAAATILPQQEALEPTRPNGPGAVVLPCADNEGEARRVARSVRDNHIPGGRWAEQAVLVRTNAQVRPLIDALERAGIPTSTDANANILELPRVADFLKRVSNRYPRLQAAAAEIRAEDDEHDDRATLEAFIALSEMAKQHLALDPDASTNAFIEWLRVTIAPDYRSRDGVAVMTFHGAKGLEWPVVHIAGLEEGLVPISWATTELALQEERRLLYVAITRAQRQVVLSWAAERTFGKRTVKRKPSRFIEGFEHASVDEAPAPDTRDQLKHLRDVRTQLEQTLEDKLAQPEDEPELLADALRSWRTTTARAAGVPAYVVFPDRTLDALVQKLPRTPNELSEVPGIGPVKLSRYGETLLELIAENATGTVIDLRR